MSSRIDRFKKRKEIKDRNQSLPLVRGLVDQALVDNLLEQPMDLKKIEDLDYSTDLNISFEISLKEADALILDLKKSLNKKRLLALKLFFVTATTFSLPEKAIGPIHEWSSILSISSSTLEWSVGLTWNTSLISLSKSFSA